MGDQTKKKRIEKATIYALLGILFTVILGVPAIYLAVHEKRPHISYEILGDSKVLDVHQPVKDLEIRYRGEDIYAQKKNLRVLTITIRNDGEIHIRPIDFDPSMPWGLQLKGGQLVDIPKLVADNSEYIHDNINLQSTTNNLIIFQKIIFERGKYFTIELQILHHAEVEPQLEVLGKIAGIETSTIIRNQKDNGGPNFWASVFYGSLTVQLVRIFVFVVGTVLLLFTIIFLIVTISDTLTSRKVKKKEQIIEAFLGPLLGAKDATASQYLRKLLSLSKGDIQRLQELKAFLANPIQTKPFLQSVAKSDFSRPQIKQLPAILRRENFPPRIARRYPDGHLVPQFDFSNSMFVAKRLGSDELTIRQEIIPLIDELMTYLDKNQMPAKLAKILSDNFSSSLTSGTTILEATVE
jgi:hypothetical protein